MQPNQSHCLRGLNLDLAATLVIQIKESSGRKYISGSLGTQARGSIIRPRLILSHEKRVSSQKKEQMRKA